MICLVRVPEAHDGGGRRRAGRGRRTAVAFAVVAVACAATWWLVDAGAHWMVSQVVGIDLRGMP